MHGGGGNAVKKTESSVKKNSVHEKWGILFFFTAFPPPLFWDSVFSRAEIFGLLSLRHFLFYVGARVLGMTTWLVMAL